MDEAVQSVPVMLGATIFMYLSSALYQVLPENRANRAFRVLDHGAIFLLIAGTYTPFTLGVLRAAWGWTLSSIVWSLAVLGMTLNVAGTGAEAVDMWRARGTLIDVVWGRPTGTNQ